MSKASVDLLEAVSSEFTETKYEALIHFLEHYMANDAGIVSSASDILRHVEKRWGNEVSVFLLGYLGGGDFPKMDKNAKLSRDEHGRWITP